jgi:hypothetical protein
VVRHGKLYRRRNVSQDLIIRKRYGEGEEQVHYIDYYGAGVSILYLLSEIYNVSNAL